MTKIDYMLRELYYEGICYDEARVKDVLDGNYEGHSPEAVEHILDMETEWGEDA